MSKLRKTRCNGISSDCNLYPAEAVKFFKDKVNQVRQQFALDANDLSNFEGEIYMGSRYNHDDVVLQTLQSAVDNRGFLEDPWNWIYDALQDCAERDWWYKFEKSWDDSMEVKDAQRYDDLSYLP